MDTAGDGFFARFDGPARAIRCAQAITAAVQPLGIQVRAGLHSGECEVADGKVAGIAVSIGARIAGMGGIRNRSGSRGDFAGDCLPATGRSSHPVDVAGLIVFPTIKSLVCLLPI